MFIKEKLNQSRRDFTALYRCQFCGDEHVSGGYDDANFHQNVVPAMVCKKCGKSGAGKIMEPRYPAGYQV